MREGREEDEETKSVCELRRLSASRKFYVANHFLLSILPSHNSTSMSKVMDIIHEQSHLPIHEHPKRRARVSVTRGRTTLQAAAVKAPESRP